jgi:hypothetical protein
VNRPPKRRNDALSHRHRFKLLTGKRRVELSVLVTENRAHIIHTSAILGMFCSNKSANRLNTFERTCAGSSAQAG